MTNNITTQKFANLLDVVWHVKSRFWRVVSREHENGLLDSLTRSEVRHTLTSIVPIHSILSLNSQVVNTCSRLSKNPYTMCIFSSLRYQLQCLKTRGPNVSYLLIWIMCIHVSIPEKQTGGWMQKQTMLYHDIHDFISQFLHPLLYVYQGVCVCVY